MAKKPDLDEATLRVMARMVRMPPKPHDEMKVGKRMTRTAKSRAKRGAVDKAIVAALGKEKP
jgi:hypothetical protein